MENKENSEEPHGPTNANSECPTEVSISKSASETPTPLSEENREWDEQVASPSKQDDDEDVPAERSGNTPFVKESAKAPPKWKQFRQIRKYDRWDTKFKIK